MSYKKATDKKQPNSASEEAGQNLGEQVAGDFDSVIVNLENEMINYIGAKVVQGVMMRLSKGDLGTTAPKLLTSFKSASTSHLTQQIQQIEAWDNDPKLLPSSSSELMDS
jgi:hypothetical protein